MRRPSLVSAILASLLASSLVAPSAAAATDLRIQLNPVLAELHQRDPAKAAAILEELNRIIEGPKPPAPGTRSIENPQERDLIHGNPLFEEAWRIDPKAALEQLREIVAAGGGQ
jgi:hypothetical protein